MKNFFKQSSIIFLLLSCIFPVKAQDWIGYHSSNYGGINNVGIQPASIADSRFKFMMNLIAIDYRVSNNYLMLKNDVFRKFNFDDIDRDSFTESDKNNEKGAFGNINAQLPSFMLTLSPKHAIGFSVRSRTMLNADNISSDVSRFIDKIEEKGDFTIDPKERFDIENLYAQAHSWSEYGLTYARVVMDGGTHFLKAGLTAKLLNGVGSGYGYINKLQYTGLDSSRVNLFEANVTSGISDNFDIDDDDFSEEDLRKRFFNSPDKGFGFDLGVEYEHRPHHEEYRYTMDGEEGLFRRDRNKYKYKIGLSLLDIGSIKYDKSPSSGNIKSTTLKTSDLDVNNLNGDIEDILDSLFVYEHGGSYTMGLPSRLVGQFDYNLFKSIYLNFTSQAALKTGNSDVEKTHYLSTVSLTPRVENTYIGLAVPMSYDKFANFNAGASVRLGPLVVGSKDIISGLLGKDLSEMDVHFALRWALPYRKRKDKDQDSVSKRYDQCPEVPGVWEFKGCPDTDNDGIQDSEDECPEVAGVEAFKGCPDSDEDGVKDSEDECPETAGLPELKGCPDSDGDGIKDSEDLCPQEAGVKAFGGCPDTDSDGVKDSEDACPKQFGPKEKQGCPDSDGDGIHDHEDKCPDVTGTLENRGCPEADKDNDGVIDKEDKCPSTPGAKENNGCPVLEKEEQEIIDTAFDNLEFKTGSSVIATSSHNSLNRLAELLKKKSSWRLLLEGHTDNQGSRSGNQRLSKNRAQSVANYLEKEGIDKTRFSVIGYGPDRPIADNRTKEGRQKNRRVEMTILFE